MQTSVTTFAASLSILRAFLLGLKSIRFTMLLPRAKASPFRVFPPMAGSWFSLCMHTGLFPSGTKMPTFTSSICGRIGCFHSTRQTQTMSKAIIHGVATAAGWFSAAGERMACTPALSLHTSTAAGRHASRSYFRRRILWLITCG